MIPKNIQALIDKYGEKPTSAQASKILQMAQEKGIERSEVGAAMAAAMQKAEEAAQAKAEAERKAKAEEERRAEAERKAKEDAERKIAKAKARKNFIVACIILTILFILPMIILTILSYMVENWWGFIWGLFGLGVFLIPICLLFEEHKKYVDGIKETPTGCLVFWSCVLGFIIFPCEVYLVYESTRDKDLPNNYVVVRQFTKCGLGIRTENGIDTLTAVEFKDISYISDYTTPFDSIDALFMVKKDGLYGLLGVKDSIAQQLTDTEYESIDRCCFISGNRHFYKVQKDNRCGMIDHLGATVFELKYDDIIFPCSHDINGRREENLFGAERGDSVDYYYFYNFKTTCGTFLKEKEAN